MSLLEKLVAEGKTKYAAIPPDAIDPKEYAGLVGISEWLALKELRSRNDLREIKHMGRNGGHPKVYFVAK